jgi:hypothetical protein
LRWIEELAFSQSGLQAIWIPSSVCLLGKACFSGCSALELVNFGTPSSLDRIEESAFSGAGLTSITIPSTVTILSDSAFSECSRLESVTFEGDSGLVSIGKSAFSRSGLTSITIPSTVSDLSQSAFSQCTSLASVAFAPESKCATIGAFAFSETALTSVVLPACVTDLLDSCFAGCRSLESVRLPCGSRLRRIGASAFSETALAAFECPASVIAVGASAFSGCRSLSSFTFQGHSPSCWASPAAIAAGLRRLRGAVLADLAARSGTPRTDVFGLCFAAWRAAPREAAACGWAVAVALARDSAEPDPALARLLFEAVLALAPGGWRPASQADIETYLSFIGGDSKIARRVLCHSGPRGPAAPSAPQAAARAGSTALPARRMPSPAVDEARFGTDT